MLPKKKSKTLDELILEVGLKSDINPISFIDAFMGNKGNNFGLVEISDS